MAIIATNEGKTFEITPAGSYVARCYSMVQLGTIKEENSKYGEANKVRISWELPTELRIFKEENGEQPISISKEFNISMNEKSNLRKFLENWRGKNYTEEQAKSFDITKLLGQPCMISVIHKTSKSSGKTYADIGSVSMPPKGMECPEQINPSFEFSFDVFDLDKFNSLPDWLREKISKSKEFKAIQQHGTTDETMQVIMQPVEKDAPPF